MAGAMGQPHSGARLGLSVPTYSCGNNTLMLLRVTLTATPLTLPNVQEAANTGEFCPIWH